MVKTLIEDDQLRKDAWNDLFIFDKLVCQYTWCCDVPHSEFLHFVQNWKKLPDDPNEYLRKLILTPRKTLKTSLVTIGYTLWRIWHDPNIRVFICAEERAKSKQFLSEAKAIIDTDRFKAICGDWVREKGWTDDEITVKGRLLPKKEPTITTAGIDASDQGPHYDLLIGDDIHGKKNSKTTVQIQKVIDNLLLFDPLMEDSAQLLIIGTRWDYSDAYAYLEEKQSEFYETFIRSAEPDDDRDTYYWPPTEIVDDKGKKKIIGLGPKKLANLKKRMTPYFYSCQYQNNPTGDEATKPFHQQYFHPYEKKNLPLHARKYLLLDPASTVTTYAARSALVLAMVDTLNDIYIHYTWQDRVQPGRLIEQVISVCGIYKPDILAVEITGFVAIGPILREALSRNGMNYIFVQELKHAGKNQQSKKDRILGMEIYYRAGKIYHLQNECRDLELQELRFPGNMRNIDLIDALSFLPEVANLRQENEGEEEGPLYTYDPLCVSTGY